jgi:hypothetical protein
MHTVSKNLASRAVSASPVPSALCQLDLCRVHSGDPTCPKSKDTIAPTHSAKATSTRGNLRICILEYEGFVRNSAESARRYAMCLDQRLGIRHRIAPEWHRESDRYLEDCGERDAADDS